MGGLGVGTGGEGRGGGGGGERERGERKEVCGGVKVETRTGCGDGCWVQTEAWMEKGGAGGLGVGWGEGGVITNHLQCSVLRCSRRYKYPHAAQACWRPH